LIASAGNRVPIMNELLPSPAGTGLLLSDDLLFSSRITGEARNLNLVVKTARSVEILKKIVGPEDPACVFVDLSNPGLVLVDLMAWLRQSFSKMPRVVAYGSHVEAATLHSAREAGCDEVMPRSKFVEVMPMKLREWFTID
jgi:CheY-like chemotaxis protein